MPWKPTTNRFVTMRNNSIVFLRKACGCLLLAALAFMLSGPSRALAQEGDRIVAVVNGDIITMYELDKRFAPVMKQFEGKEISASDEERIMAMKRQLLDRWIEDMLLLQECKRFNINVTEAEAEARLKAILQQNRMNDQQLAAELTKKNLTRAEYMAEMRKEISISRLLDYMVRAKVAVSNEDVEAYYRNNMGAYESGRKVVLRLIVLPMDMDAESLREKIVDKDMTFEEAAKKHSVGPGAETGGDLGTLGWDQLAPDWRKMLEGMKPGEVSKPFDLSGRKALLKFVQDSSGDSKPLPAVAEQIRDKLAKPKYEETYANFISKLKSKAIIEIKL